MEEKKNRTSRRNFMGALIAGVAASAIIPMTANANIGKGKASWKDLKPGVYAAIGGYLQSCVWEEPTKENHDRMIQTLNSMVRPIWEEGSLYDYKFVISNHTESELTVKFGWKVKSGTDFTISSCTVSNRNY